MKIKCFAKNKVNAKLDFFHPVKSLNLDEIISEIKKSQYSESWIVRAEGKTLYLLTNPENAVLTYVELDLTVKHEDPEKTFVSILEKNNRQEEKFYALNNEVQKYPSRNVIDKKFALEKFKEFYDSGEVKGVEWERV